jgi:hypothetical protein
MAASREVQHSRREQKRQGRVHCANSTFWSEAWAMQVVTLDTDSAHDVIGGQLGRGQKAATAERIAQLEVADLMSPAQKRRGDIEW